MSYGVKELPGERFQEPHPSYYGAEPPEEPQTHLRDYLHVLRKHRWVILAFLLGTLSFAVLYSYTRTPLYAAVASLQIDREISPIMDSTSFWMSYRWDAEFLETQIKLIKSRSMARRVVMVDDELRSMVSPTKTRGMDPDEVYAGPIAVALSGLAVEPIRMTRLVEIQYYSSDPVQAQRLANEFAEQFIQSSRESRYETTQEATAFLAEQVERIQDEIKTKEVELQRYGSQVEILSPNAQDSIVAQKLESIAGAQIQAQRDRIDKEIVYRDLQQAGSEGKSALLAHPLLSQLQSELVALRQRHEELSSKYKPDWPEMVLLQRQIEGKNERIKEERERVQSEMLAVARNDYQMALQREQSFNQQLAVQKKQTSELNQNAIYYNTLKLEIDNQKGLLDTLLKRQSETGVQARLQGAKTSNITIVDRAMLPKSPYFPNHFQNILLGIIAGLGLGVGAAVLLNYLDNSVKSPDELYRVTQLPALGVVPKMMAQPKRKLLAGKSGNGDGSIALSFADPLNQQRQSDFAEAFNLIRSSVLLSSMDNPPRSILVTSSVPSEGKTTTAINLAISMAQTDKNVLLIDADMRRPQLHRAFRLSNRVGLSKLLSGQARPNQAIQKSSIKGLLVLTSGPVPPNPSELLSGRRIRNLMTGCQKVFDMVIIDSPPALSFADAFHLAVLVDGVILVVEAGETPREVLLRGRQRFDEVHARILGVVLNKAEMQKEDYYYYKGYYHYSSSYKSEDSATESPTTTITTS
jgi:capsular exopolysaccharide synthesis family protein